MAYLMKSAMVYDIILIDQTQGEVNDRLEVWK